jgi:predicted ATPase
MLLDGPILDKVKIAFNEKTDFTAYPFSLSIIKKLSEISFPTQVTFIVGENGTGKSTILEAVALKAGFGKEGGSKNIQFNTAEDTVYSGVQNLSSCMTLSWRKKPRAQNGYFFRAESFFNIANHIDNLAHLPMSEGGTGEYLAYRSYGGKSLHEQSHGESFLSFFNNSIGDGGFFIFDEPEAALSPQRQLALLAIMHERCKNKETQFIIATHSPILLAYPGATIYSCDDGSLKKISYKETKHYEITKNFLDNPKLYFKHLFDE